MRRAQRRTSLQGFTLPRWLRSQPNYHSEISDEYLDALQRKIDSEKSEKSKLTPISEPGW